MGKFICEIEKLKSVTLVVKDVAESTEFYTKIWGLHEVHRTQTTAQLRASGPEHHVLELLQGQEVGLHCITWGAASQDAVLQLFERLKLMNVVIHLEPHQLPQEGGGFGFAFKDPEGRIHQVVASSQTHAPLHIDSLVDHVCPTQLSHVVVNTLDVKGMSEFLQNVLGFKLSDSTHKMSFFRCNASHHSIALADFGSVSLNHVAFEMGSWNELMFGVGRVKLAGYALQWGLGRHGPGDNIFSYFLDPNGLVIEYTAEVQQITDPAWKPGTPEQWARPPERMDQWGFSPQPSEVIKKAMGGQIGLSGRATA
jgi:catechol-2,3-dioxygenase